jgi:hypothetical protein
MNRPISRVNHCRTAFEAVERFDHWQAVRYSAPAKKSLEFGRAND